MDGLTNSVSTHVESVRIDNVESESQADIRLSPTKSFKKLHADGGVNDRAESSTTGQTTIAANQRLAMGCLAGLAMVFSIVNYLLQS